VKTIEDKKTTCLKEDKKEKEHHLKDAFNARGYLNLATAK